MIPFNRARSLRLDAVILRLEADPPRWRRVLLRLAKRWLERGL